MADERIRRLFLCRHAMSEGNRKYHYCGGKDDSPLADEGRKQASLLGIALYKYYKFEGHLIVASNRKRAVETAEIVSQHLYPKPSVIKVGGLSELDLGDWCGKTAEEAEKQFPEEHKAWRQEVLSPKFRFPGGESMAEARKRMVRCFELIKELWLNNGDQDSNDMIVVAHGGTNMIILSEILRIKMNTFAYRALKQDNTCVNIVTYDEDSRWRPKIQITLVNSTHHLDYELK